MLTCSNIPTIDAGGKAAAVATGLRTAWVRGLDVWTFAGNENMIRHASGPPR